MPSSQLFRVNIFALSPTGDLFSCHAVDNPDMESEMSMLRQYGPDVPEHVLKKLVTAFGELRDMADQGLINYPYSTREVVNMVKHLQVRSYDCIGQLNKYTPAI